MIKLLHPKQNNIDAVLNHLLNSLNVKVSRPTREQTLPDHPSYPSLLSLSDTLTDWSIENQAYKIDKEEYDPEDLYYPFIAHGNANGGQFMLVKQIEAGNVRFADEKGASQNITEKEFLNFWSGIALYATASEKSGEDSYRENYLKGFFNQSRIPLAIAVTIASFAFAVSATPLTLGISLLMLVKLIGVTVSILLLMHSINANNPLIQNLCSLGNKNDCNAILKSDAAKVTNWLSWSEVGFFYFAGSTLSLLISPSSFPIIVWLNILALPYTFYSIGYQYKNKNWCVLCCAVQAILTSEFLINITLNNGFPIINQSAVSFSEITAIALAFLVPIAIWAFVKPFFAKATQLNPLKHQLKKFKYNSDLFKQALTSQPKFAVPDELMPIILGNPNAETSITMVSNLYCPPCAKAHEFLHTWLKDRTDINVKIIFTTLDLKNDVRKKIASQLLSINNSKSQDMAINALFTWYNLKDKNYEKWQQSYSLQEDTGIKFSDVIESQRKWCEFVEITHTPSFFINGYKLNKPYYVEDLKYLLS